MAHTNERRAVSATTLIAIAIFATAGAAPAGTCPQHQGGALAAPLSAAADRVDPFRAGVTGACCLECSGTCTSSDDVECTLLGGRFEPGITCAQLNPPCGSALGACCHDNGTCTMSTCAACLGERRACCLPGNACIDTTSIDCYERGGVWKTAGSSCATAVCNLADEACCFTDGSCSDLFPSFCAALGGVAHGPGTRCAAMRCTCRGDLNDDGQVDFKDINPFTLFLFNRLAWHAAFPSCPQANGDINCDGTLNLRDINPFVVVLSSTRLPIPCGDPQTACPRPAEPRSQGNTWGGPDSTCDPNNSAYGCCTVAWSFPVFQENEPLNCADVGYNGGCDSFPPSFHSFIDPSLAVSMYGQSGTYTIADPANPGHLTSARDTDWYEYTPTSGQIFTLTIRAEFDPYLAVYHAGPDPNAPCDGYWYAAPPLTGSKCNDVQLVTGCLPPGKYWFVVAPASFSGVPCGADYLLTLQATGCGAGCSIRCSPDHFEANPCNDQPDFVDTNGGCSAEPPDPNKFEVLDLTSPSTYVLCGTTWASGGARDEDWYQFTMPQSFRMDWVVETDVRLRASIVFRNLGNGEYGPPTCDEYSVWSDALAYPCVGLWNHPEYVYQPGTYWFVVSPEDAGGPIWYGYPCVLRNDYRIELTFPDGPYLSEGEPTCGPGYVDSYDGGCDDWSTHRTLPIQIQPSHSNDYSSRSGAWRSDPNDPNTLRRDYDWYSFTTPATPAAGRFSIYCEAEFPVTWQIWPGYNCAAGPIEGLRMPAHYSEPVLAALCYNANTTYWLRVFPTDATALCGDEYSLALFDWTGCSPCNINCGGMPFPDDPCDDVNDFDTNEGCNGSPVNPAHFMNYVLGRTYCGAMYAKIWPNYVPHHDPDWFKIHLASATGLRLRVQAALPVFVALYSDCSQYQPNQPHDSALGYMEVLTACNGSSFTDLDFPVLSPADYVGVIYLIDTFGNVLTEYYPCSSGHNLYKIQVTSH